jgi:segregation and condensation protein B
MERSAEKRIVEALILAAPEPIPAARLAEIVPLAGAAAARALVDELNADYARDDRAFEIWEVAGGYQIRTRSDLAPWVQQLQSLRPVRLSAPALETLALIAYRQPLTRAEIEHVRGVDVGATLRSLLDRKLVRIAGHRDVPGRPMLYATTKRFLEVFGLASLEDLPTLRDLQELGGDALAAGLAGAAPEVLALPGEPEAAAPGVFGDDPGDDDDELEADPDDESEPAAGAGPH